MGSHSAFFYGTLMVPKVLYRVCYNNENADKDPTLSLLTSQLTIRSGLLHNFSRRRVKHVDYPGIIAQAGHMVKGTYVTGLSDADLAHLDAFEGDEYTRKEVAVEVEGRDEKAETYVFTAGDVYLEEQEWDFDEFLREKMHRWVGRGSEKEYLEVDQVRDPTGGRSPKPKTEEEEEVSVENEKVLDSAV